MSTRIESSHTCASLMFSMDVPLEAVADQLGHASMGVTKGVCADPLELIHL